MITLNKILVGGIIALSAVIVTIWGVDSTPKGPGARFTHGVASGDPQHESILLWTRLLAEDSSDVELSWELSKDSAFSQIIISGKAKALRANDFCTKVIAEGLEAGSRYFYRFRYQDTYSEIGRTNTLPAETDHVRIGVVNCSKYTGGYYHAYDALANMEDIDVVIHLGDYIYENGPSVPGSSYWPAYQATGRQHDPEHECFSLEDYRTRYAQYRGDKVLQKLHARYPMITIWDDHEIAMKPLKELPEGGMQYNGDWESRLQNSLKAYHEWLPLRPEAGEKIYRSFQLGDIVNLMMVDTRVCCKSEVIKTKESIKDSSRHIVGNKQLQWIFDEVEEHKAVWNVFGNQLLMARKDADWERWPGFHYDRQRLIDFLQSHQQYNYLVTTGNAHNPHHYVVLDDKRQDTILHEFLPGSVSSGNKTEKSVGKPGALEKHVKKLDKADNLLWYDLDSHGFIVLDLNRDRAVSEWYFVSSIRKKNYTVSMPYKAVVPARKGQ